MSDSEHNDLLKAIHDLALQIAIVKQKQEDNHADNKNDIRILYDKMLKVDALPCLTHMEKLRQYDVHIAEGQAYRRILVGLIFTLILSAAGVAVAWGQLQERVIQNERQNKQAWDRCCEKEYVKNI
jgi:hypothetical protein